MDKLDLNETATPAAGPCPVIALVCQACGHIQGDPAPCDVCSHRHLVPMEGPTRAKALMPAARPL